MKQINFTNLGGLPFSQDRADYMQQSYTEPLKALARLCGDKVILYGVESDGVNVTDGWIAYNGELLFFQGGSYAADVVINTATTNFTFANNTSNAVYSNKTATCGISGAFPFSDLVPLLSLQNTWKKDDIRQCMKDATYVAANFDATTGVGTSAAEKGWKILTKAYTDAAGAVLVNVKPGDSDFGTVGNYGGAKTHTLTSAEQGSYDFKTKNDDIGGGVATVTAILNVNGSDIAAGGSNQSSYGTTLNKKPNNDATAHNNLQPYFVVLTLIKL